MLSAKVPATAELAVHAWAPWMVKQQIGLVLLLMEQRILNTNVGKQMPQAATDI